MSQNDEFITLRLLKNQYPDIPDSLDEKLLLIVQQANRDLTADLSSAVSLVSLTGTPHFQFAQGVVFTKAEALYEKRILKDLDAAKFTESQYEKGFAKLVGRIRKNDSPRKFASTTFEDDLLSVHSQDMNLDD